MCQARVFKADAMPDFILNDNAKPKEIDAREFELACQNLGLARFAPASSTAACAQLATPPKELPEIYTDLRVYVDLLLRWNSKINLTAAKTWQQALYNLLADSFYLADFLKTLPLTPEPRLWDLGAGAGLPGIPLRILWPCGTYYLVEIREKRALFMRTVLASLKLPATFVQRGKAEEFMQSELEKGEDHWPDCIISRAFKPWPELLELTRPYLIKRCEKFSPMLLLMLNGDKFEHTPAGWLVLGQKSYTSPSGARQFVALCLE